MLLAKCCHDLDWLSFVVGRRCVAVSSFGGLGHFRAEERPPGAGDRCLECEVEASCPFSAPRLYLGMLERGVVGWPVDVVAWPATEENVMNALRDGPYGRCVWACDNDVVDHQVVSLHYENGATANLTMTGFSRMRDRDTRIFGTRGELHGDGNTIEVYDFLTGTIARQESGVYSDGEITTRHGGGDDGVMAEFIAAVVAGDPGMIPTTPAQTLESHRVAFAAEAARRQGRVIALDAEASTDGPRLS
jgi:Oxidoreductase family, C-terminal alpha/beta domain